MLRIIFINLIMFTKKHTGPCLHFNKFWYLMKASLLQQHKWSWMKEKELSLTVPKAVLCPNKVYIVFFMVELKGIPLLWTSFCVSNNLIKPNKGNTWSSRIKRKQIIFYCGKSMFLWCSIWKFLFIHYIQQKLYLFVSPFIRAFIWFSWHEKVQFLVRLHKTPRVVLYWGK